VIVMREKQTRQEGSIKSRAPSAPTLTPATLKRIREACAGVSMTDEVHPAIVGVTQVQRKQLEQLRETYLHGLWQSADAALRRPLLEELERAAQAHGLPGSTGANLVLELLEQAAKEGCEAARTKAQVSELWRGFSVLARTVRSDRDAAIGPGRDHEFDAFAHEVSENVQATSAALFVLAQATTPFDAAERILEVMRASLTWDFGLYFLVSEHDNALALAHVSGEVSETIVAACRQARLTKKSGTIGKAWRTGDIAVAELSSGSDGESDLEAEMHHAGVRRIIALPVMVGQQVAGVLAFLVRRELDVTESRRDVLRNVAILMSSSFERMAQVVNMRDLAASAEAVNRVLRRLNVASTASEAAHGALEALRDAFDWDYGASFTLDPATDELYCSADSGTSSEDFRKTTMRMRYRRGVGVNGCALEHSEFVVVDDLGNVEGEPRAAVARTAGIRTGVCFPVVARGEVVGTIEVWSKRSLVLSDARLEALRSISQVVSSTLERLEERDGFAKSLQEFAAELVGVSTSLRASSAEQSASAQQLASAVGEVTATLSELRETSGEALRNAESVIAKAEGAFQTSASGRDSVQRAIDSMRSIREQVGEIAERILQLNDQTSQIGSIIATVNEISAQSKLLALNAAIEAARAGEHGKGFGVVANEIRSLAEQSKEATGQVREILGEIQNGTNAAVVAAEEGTKKAESGMALADVSGERILELARSMEESSSSARLIANSARQQSAGVEQVAQALVSIDSATNATASGLKQTEQATAQLLTLAERMAEAVRAMVPIRPIAGKLGNPENQNDGLSSMTPLGFGRAAFEDPFPNVAPSIPAASAPRQPARKSNP
jgi:methyl-accepting chemotaxis protein/putative methionine-R-sulfoxide reductase with GAF domain